MSTARTVFHCTRPCLTLKRPGAVLISRYFSSNEREHDEASSHPEEEVSKHPNSHLTNAASANGGDLEVGEMEGGKFKIEPLRRTGEDAATMRARLLCM